MNTIPKLLTVADIAEIIGWSTRRTRDWLRRRGVLESGATSRSSSDPSNRRHHLIPRDKLLALQESASLLDFDGLPGDDYLR